MANNAPRIGWIGAGRMGLPMAELLVKAGHDVSVWNRTAAKAEPLGRLGAKVVGSVADLARTDIVFSIVSTGADLEEVYSGAGGVAANKAKLPAVLVDCSTIGVDESAAIRAHLAALGAAYIAAPVSGNARVIVAGKLCAVASGPEAAFRKVEALIEAFAPNGVSYVGEGELARVCKIAHNVMLGVVIENLIEITLLANKMGVPRHAFLAFINNSVMGSAFTRYKSPALVNLDWTTTFTPELLRKDIDLGLELGHKLEVAMPVTAAAREMLQNHIGSARLRPDAETYLAADFAALLETMARASGLRLESERQSVPTGLDD